MIKQVVILFLCTLLFSCKKDDNKVFLKKEKKIIAVLPPDTTTTPAGFILGDWLEGPHIYNGKIAKQLKYHSGYEFFVDGSCDFKPGYFDYTTYFDYSKPRKKVEMEYLGRKTNYKLSKGGLSIYNLSEKKWDKYKIKTLTRDSLVIGRDTIYSIYLKKRYLTDTIPDFDAVIVSSGPCHGSCSVNSTMVESNGKVTYYGGEYIDNKGFYTSHISTADFKAIMHDFKKADYHNLYEDYSYPEMHCSTTTVCFIKNGKIIKSISDRCSGAPREFVFAYNAVEVLHQKLKFTSLKVPDQLLTDGYMHFEANGNYFTDSESFYLVYRLINGRITNKDFDEKYSFVYGMREENTIKSDGRYFKLQANNREITIDIGSDFFEENNFYTHPTPEEMKKRDKEWTIK